MKKIIANFNTGYRKESFGTGSWDESEFGEFYLSISDSDSEIEMTGNAVSVDSLLGIISECFENQCRTTTMVESQLARKIMDTDMRCIPLFVYSENFRNNNLNLEYHSCVESFWVH